MENDLHKFGPARARPKAWAATCGSCGITIGVRDDPEDAQTIATEHNRIYHPYDFGEQMEIGDGM